MADSIYVDPKGYWVDPDRNVRRMGGEQEIILKPTEECSDIEWSHLFEAIRDCLPKIR
jgi:hypothetical protein